MAEGGWQTCQIRYVSEYLIVPITFMHFLELDWDVALFRDVVAGTIMLPISDRNLFLAWDIGR
jgi:hypothetical protein